MSFTKHNNYEVPDGGVQNWDASLNQNFELQEKGQTIKATAGEALTEGEVVYVNISERLNLAISPTGSTTASQFLGFIQDDVVDEVDGYVQINGNILYPHWAFTLGPVYLDASTPGAITQTEPTTATLVGYAIGTNELVIKPWATADHGSLSGLSGDDHTQYFRTDNVRSVSGITVTGAMQVDSITPYSEGWVSVQAGLTVGDLNVQGAITGNFPTTNHDHSNDANAGFAIGVVQIVSGHTGGVNTGTTAIPNDDTIPEITEGDEFMSLYIKPKDINNTLYVSTTWYGSHSASTNLIAALFQDTETNAKGVISQFQSSAAGFVTLNFTTKIDTTLTPAGHTFTVRAGTPDGATTTFNGSSGASWFGLMAQSSIIITEMKES